MTSKLPLPPRTRPMFAPKAAMPNASDVKAKADKAAKPPKAKDATKATKAAADWADKKAARVWPSNLQGGPGLAERGGDKRAKTGEAMGVFGVRLPAPMAAKLRKAAKARKVAPAVIVREALEKVL